MRKSNHQRDVEAAKDQPPPYELMEPPVVLRTLDRAHLARPSAARVYDCYLRGSHNFAVDRYFVRKQRRILPIVEEVARHNRAFLGRAIHYACERGIRQFLDLGSGVPTGENTHEVAEHYFPGENKVVYVDNEPIAIGHAERILKKTGDPERHMIMSGDLRRPDDLWRRLRDNEQVQLDWNEPVCLILVAVLHFIGPQHAPEQWMRRFRQIIPPRSLLVMSHMTDDGVPTERKNQAEEFRRNYTRTTNPGYYRTRAEFEALFGNMRLIEPGITWTVQWRNETEMELWPKHLDPAEAMILCGVAEKPDAKTF